MKAFRIAFMVVLTLLTLLSLAVNAALIFGLMQYQKITLAALDSFRTTLTNVQNEKIEYTFNIDQEIPFVSTFPFKDEFTVPIDMTIPVNTTVSVPIDLGFTTYRIKVPINTVFPFKMDFTVPVSMSIPVSITVPVRMAVPVEIPLADFPLITEYLGEADASLSAFQAQLADPVAVIRQALAGTE
jgi:hypothetical protein